MSNLAMDPELNDQGKTPVAADPETGSDGRDDRIRQLELRNQELAKEIQDLKEVGAVVRTITGTLLIEEVLTGILQGIRSSLAYERVVLGLIHTGMEFEELKMGVGPGVEELLEQRWPIAGDDPAWRILLCETTPQLFPDREEWPPVIRKVFPDGFIKAPIRVKGDLIGTVMCSAADRFSDREVHLLQILVEYAGIALENGRLYYNIIRSQEELQRTQKQLVEVEKLAAIGQLAVSINHEINNPLCTIKMGAQMLKFDLERSAPDLAGRLDAILESVDRITQVTRKVSNLKRLECKEYLPNQLMVEL